MTRNLLRSPTGRAWIAIRDSEIAAQSMGVNLAVYKSIACAFNLKLERGSKARLQRLAAIHKLSMRKLVAKMIAEEEARVVAGHMRETK
jgi:hypothetical protein